METKLWMNEVTKEVFMNAIIASLFVAGLMLPAQEVLAYQSQFAYSRQSDERRPVTRGVRTGRDIYICGRFYCYGDGSRVPDIDTIWGGRA